jgi:branched-subunit amino acid transport protein AzlD
MSHIKKLDYFGQKVELNIGNDPEFKTKAGGFITVSIIIVLIVFCFSAVNFLLLTHKDV